MEFLPSAFDALRQYKQFVIYLITPSKTRPGKNDKIPIDPHTKRKLEWGQPANWLDADTAIQLAKQCGAGHGVGFVFTKQDPFFFLDIDNCLTPCGTAWNPLANHLMSAFPGAAIEVSSSGKGLHIIASGTDNSELAHACKNEELNLEFYTAGRFVALTGIQAQGSAALDCSVVIPWLINNYFPPKNSGTPVEWSSEPCAGWSGPTDDEILIERMLRSQSAKATFGSGASFFDLWEANQSVLVSVYPDPERESGCNESSVDAALVQHLAFWTGNNCERMLRLMKRSKLVRDKWEREDYLRLTILSACGKQKEFLNDKPVQSIMPPEDQQGAFVVTGNTFLNAEQQLNLFKGCTYITDSHRILIPGGYSLNPERFRVVFGGYSFVMDQVNSRVSRNAWEAFTESQIIRNERADGSTFRPDLQPGLVIKKDGQALVNTYWPVVTPRKKGDPSLFLRHVEKVFNDERDGQIMISYLAACIRYLGVKFQWCPLIQGVEGNGKTLFTRCVAFAIGDRYSHFPKAQEIASKFNDWMYCKIFIGVEDIFDGRREIIEPLKPMITGARLEIEPKGGAKVTQDICCNFLINTNHKDGLRKHRTDRRFAPFYTRQQRIEDLKRDGMNGDYFFDLYTWLHRQDGFAITADYLDNFDIPDEFNPATKCQRAPITSSTEIAIVEGISGVEQEILEAVEQGQIGFKGGFISSIMLDSLLTRLRANTRVPINKRRDMLKALGYDWHPALKEGRVNNVIMPDGGKPRLFIKEGHVSTGVLSGAEVSRLYTEAQSS